MSTTVIVCGDVERDAFFPPDAIAVDALCQDPSQLRDVEVQSGKVVLVLHRDQYHLPDVQKALRGIDVDPLGAQILDIDQAKDEVEPGLAIEGLRARAEAFGGTVPDHSKPVFPRSVTRRGFLRPPTPAYVSVPRIAHALCAADDGCRACVDVCPQSALRWQSGRVVYDKDTCIPCGRCVTACPTGAIENPTITPAMIEAQVRALIASGGSPVGIRFVCSRGEARSRGRWMDVTVPCTSMVPGSWLVACLLLGAGAVYAVTCADSECPLDLSMGAIQANDLAHAVLAESGFDPKVVSGEMIGEPLVTADMEDPFGRSGAANVMMALAEMTDVNIDVRHPAANTGIVEIDSSACTLCGQCAKTCPTHALVEVYEDDVVSISFDAKACVNCTQCVSACPEIGRGAISVTGRVSVDLLSAGRQTLNEGTVATCDLCGNAIAPATMMSRIGDLLGEEFEATMAMLESRCLDCRGSR